MVRPSLQIVASIAGIVLLWVAAGTLISFVAEMAFGLSFAERFIPFANAHLLEEVVEEGYSPVTDPVFLIHSLLISILVFGSFTLYLARGPFRQHRILAAIPAAVAIGVLTWLWRYVWGDGYPEAMTWAASIYLSANVVATIGGLVLAVVLSKRSIDGTAG